MEIGPEEEFVDEAVEELFEAVVGGGDRTVVNFINQLRF